MLGRCRVFIRGEAYEAELISVDGARATVRVLGYEASDSVLFEHVKPDAVTLKAMAQAGHDTTKFFGDPSVQSPMNVRRREPDQFLLQFFRYDHLPPHLQAVSEPFGVLASKLMNLVPRNAERTTALRKLLEAKDCAVRALVAKES